MEFGKELTRYIGSMSQIGGIRRYQLLEGRSKGAEIAQVNNGSGLVFDIVLDRCMDICNCSIKGFPVSYVSKHGISVPGYADRNGYEWMRGFFAGLFTTCGSINAGEPSEYSGRQYGLHGDLSNTPAENIIISQGWDNDRYIMSLSGKMRTGMMLFEDILLERKISCELGKNEICIEESITNEGNKKEPFMLAYHYNFGYPLINENSAIFITENELLPFSDESKPLLKDWNVFAGPESNTEAAYFHKFSPGARPIKNYDSFLILNDSSNPEYAVELSFDSRIFYLCMQWRHFVKSEYCLAMQPSNSYLMGVSEEEKNGTLQYIEPGEEIKHSMFFKVHDSIKEIETAKNKYIQSKNIF